MESKNNNDVEEERTGLSIFSVPGEYSAFQPQYRTLTYTEMESTHNHCLFNCDEVTPYIECVTLYILFKHSYNINTCEIDQHVLYFLQTTPGNH